MCFFQMAILFPTPPCVHFLSCSLSHLSPFLSLPFAEADGAEPNSSKLLGVPLTEEPQQRLKWQAHLEFTHNHDVGDLTWDKIEVTLPHSDKLRSLVLAGIPHSMRPQVRVLPVLGRHSCPEYEIMEWDLLVEGVSDYGLLCLAE